jgi:hexosaminidase
MRVGLLVCFPPSGGRRKLRRRDVSVNLASHDWWTVGFLQNAWARLFLPLEVEIAVSGDGESYSTLDTLSHGIPWDDDTALRRYFEIESSGESARYVRVWARNIGRPPGGHAREGEPAWVYVDEIIAR